MKNLFRLGGRLWRPTQGLQGLRLLALLPLLALATSCATVTTDTPSNLTATSARLGGTATAGSGSYVIERGVAYSTTSTTPDLNPGSTLVPLAGAGNGPFSQVVAGLRPNQLYYVRAYATASDNPTSTSGGYSYGPTVQFTTPDGAYLSSLSPSSGPVGTSVTLTGTGLTGATQVSFNGTPATTFAVVSNTTVVATVPTGATTGNVTVTSPLGTSNGLGFVVGNPTNNALAFDGINDFVALGTPASLSNLGLSGCTFESWVNINSTSTTNSVIRKDGDYSLTIFSGRPYIEVWTLGTSNYTHTYMTGTSTLTAGRWHHLAATWDGTTLRLYQDGVDVTGTQTTSLVGASGPLQLGRSSTYGEALTGRLDEVRIYNTPLTQAQVQTDMFSTTSALPANQKYYANFDQGVAGGTNTGLTSLTDQSGNGTTGTLTNFALTGTASNWVRSFPTITGIAPTTGPPGTSVSITGTNLTDATGFAFNGTATTGFTTPTADLTATVAVPTGATTGPVSVGAINLPRYDGPSFMVTVAATTAVTWTGSISSDWFTAGNWSPNTVPATTIDATIPASAPNMPAITPGTASARNLTINSGATLNQTGGTLQLAGNLTNNGTYQPTAGTVNLGTTTQSSILGSSGVRFWNLIVGANGAQQSTSASTSVQRLLTLNGNFATNNNSFTLESNAANTAMVVNNASSVVSGNVTVQRYISPGLNPNLGYRHVSAPISNATVGSLTTSGFAPVVNPAYNGSATPNLTTAFPTVYGYDQARLATTNNNLNAFDKGWFSPASTADPLAVGQGYTVLIGGGQTWNFTGVLTNGDVTVNVARNAGATAPDAGYAFIGNPYPAPLDWSLTSGTGAQNGLVNVDNPMYVYRSTDPTNPYTGVYGFYNNGVGTISPVVAQGQGFFVRVAAGQTTGSVTFKNSQRPTAYTNPTYQRTTETRPLVELALQGAGSPLTDAAFVYFEQGGTSGFDAQFDAEKLPNPSGLNLSTSLTATQRLSIDGRAPLGTTALTVPLAVGVPAAGSYTLQAAQLLNLGATPVYLRDLQTGALIDLRLQPSYSFTVSNASALLTGRFELVFSPLAALATAPAALAAQVGLYPNPATGTASVELPAALGRTAVAATLADALGRPVLTLTLPAQGATAHRLSLAGLATGVYTLHLQTSAGVIVKKLTVQ